jgi:hypothetical protein
MILVRSLRTSGAVSMVLDGHQHREKDVAPVPRVQYEPNKFIRGSNQRYRNKILAPVCLNCDMGRILLIF